MDIVDRAQAFEPSWAETCLDRHRRNSRPTALASALECEDCGTPIPEDRRLAVPGCSRCASCQEVQES